MRAVLNVFTKEEELALYVAFGGTGKVFSNRLQTIDIYIYIYIYIKDKSVVVFDNDEDNVQNWEKT